jgi:hypothetical protein
MQEKPRKRSQPDVVRLVAFHPHLTMGMALSQIRNAFVRLPSGRSLREAKINVLRIGPLHNFLRKGVKRT